ncbi:hypothetical protein P7K49_021888 [Saguinus oedipus]|uniref:Uncharacterized protein n=1 Tax=Saguinus oedipus TaxID=9490 RepID=A0ABQ9UUR5_SAGOE|nr:hypothetical protein P7K49_021888 [Saguinus oedipus]
MVQSEGGQSGFPKQALGLALSEDIRNQSVSVGRTWKARVRAGSSRLQDTPGSQCGKGSQRSPGQEGGIQKDPQSGSFRLCQSITKPGGDVTLPGPTPPLASLPFTPGCPCEDDTSWVGEGLCPGTNMKVLPRPASSVGGIWLDASPQLDSAQLQQLLSWRLGQMNPNAH